MDNTDDIKQRRVRIAVLTLFIIIVTFLAIYGIIYAVGRTGGKMLTREEIEGNIAVADASDKDYTYAASYLAEWGIRGFDGAKFKTCEYYFSKYSIYHQDSSKQLAKDTARLFLEYFYDETDHSDSEVLTDALISCYVEAFGDKYAVYRTATQHEDYNTSMSGSFVGIGVRVLYSEEDGTITVLSVNEDSAAEDAGILAGDIIHAVDGELVSELGYEGAVSKIRGDIGTDVTVTVKRGEELIDLVATRRQVIEKTVQYQITESKIAIITITQFKANTFEQFKSAVDKAEADKAKAIVFDLCDNPGGYLNSVVQVIDYIAPDGVRIASYTSMTDGEIIFEADDGHSISLPIAVVFNEHTASAGELFSAAMRDYGDMGVLDVTTVGVKTYSKGVMQSTMTFADRSTLTFTIAFYNPPCDVNYDGVGVTPDIYEEDDGKRLDVAISALIEK